ncbi:hypothetical protein ACFL4X_00395 [Gemmatimonadota bacterium]
MSHRGFAKLWRMYADGGALKNHKRFVFWCWCLIKASHKEMTQTVGFQEVKLLPGQFIFGRRKAAEELGMSEKNIRTCINSLKRAGKLAVKPANKFSVVTIVNWEDEQVNEGKGGQQAGQQNGQQNGQQGANKGPTKGHKQELKAFKHSSIDEEKDTPEPTATGTSPGDELPKGGKAKIKTEAERLAEYQAQPDKGWNAFLIAYHEIHGFLPTWSIGRGSQKEFIILTDLLAKVGGDKSLLLKIWRLYLSDPDPFFAKNSYRPGALVNGFDNFLIRARNGTGPQGVYTPDSRLSA